MPVWPAWRWWWRRAVGVARDYHATTTLATPPEAEAAVPLSLQFGARMRLVALWEQKKPTTMEDARRPYNYAPR